MYLKKIDFSKFSSIRIGPLADVVMIDSDLYPKEGYLIGGANNLLMGPKPPPLMKLSKLFDFIRIEHNHLCIGAATPGGKTVSFYKKHNIAHFEFLSHLPGTLGGMLKMNAGLKDDEIFNHLYAVRTKNGWLKKEDIAYAYRQTNLKDIVFEAQFNITQGFNASKIKIFKQMRANQPTNPSAGSAFKNPKNDYAGRLIETVGLKGHRIGNMAFSDKHANFLINLGGGTFNDAKALMRLAYQRVLQQEQIRLEYEIIIIGDPNPLQQ